MAVRPGTSLSFDTVGITEDSDAGINVDNVWLTNKARAAQFAKQPALRPTPKPTSPRIKNEMDRAIAKLERAAAPRKR